MPPITVVSQWWMDLFIYGTKVWAYQEDGTFKIDLPFLQN